MLYAKLSPNFSFSSLQFPPAFPSGDIGDETQDFRLPNSVFNTLRAHSYTEEKRVQYTCIYSGTSDKGHLCIKDTFQCTNLYSGNFNTFIPPKEGNFSIIDKTMSQCVHYLEAPL